MKIININTSFAMQKFGSHRLGNIKKSAKKIKPEVSSIVLNTPKTSQMHRTMDEYKNQIDVNLEISETSKDNEELSLLKSIENEQPCNILESLKQLELSFQNEIDYINKKLSTENFINKDDNRDTIYYMPYNEEYVRYNKDPIVSSPTFNPGIYNEEKVQTQKEILQNKILENRIKHIQKYNLEADKRNEIDKKRINIAIFLSKFLQILKKLNSTQIKLIRKQIAEILDIHKVLFEDIMQTSIQLYHQYIYQKRKQNPNYELSIESFDDNKVLLNKTQYGKLVSNSIIEKINSTEFKKNLKVMEHIFSLDLNKDIQNVFNVLNDIFLYMNEMFDVDIEYRKKYLDIIAEAIVLNSGEEKSLPQLSYSSSQNPNNHINMLQPPPPFETDFEVDINNLEL